jgi:hypothetical protein
MIDHVSKLNYDQTCRMNNENFLFLYMCCIVQVVPVSGGGFQERRSGT